MASNTNDYQPAQYLTADEISVILKISRSFVYRLMKTGDLPTIRLGRAARVNSADLQAYIASHRSFTEIEASISACETDGDFETELG